MREEVVVLLYYTTGPFIFIIFPPLSLSLLFVAGGGAAAAALFYFYTLVVCFMFLHKLPYLPALVIVGLAQNLGNTHTYTTTDTINHKTRGKEKRLYNIHIVYPFII